MPDWREYVRAHVELGGTSLEEQREIIGELATHLEDTYATLCATGLTEEDAIQRTCELAGNWGSLNEQIVAIKREGHMQNRVNQLWVPGLATLLGSAGLLALTQIAGMRPVVFRAGTPSAVVLYPLPWLLVLPAIGALGAFLSRRARASGLAVHLSSTFPAVAMAVMMLVLFIGALFVDQPVSIHLKVIGFYAAVVSWIALPGVALLLGDLAVGLILNKHETISR